MLETPAWPATSQNGAALSTLATRGIELGSRPRQYMPPAKATPPRTSDSTTAVTARSFRSSAKTIAKKRKTAPPRIPPSFIGDHVGTGASCKSSTGVATSSSRCPKNGKGVLFEWKCRRTKPGTPVLAGF